MVSPRSRAGYVHLVHDESTVTLRRPGSAAAAAAFGDKGERSPRSALAPARKLYRPSNRGRCSPRSSYSTLICQSGSYGSVRSEKGQGRDEVLVSPRRRRLPLHVGVGEAEPLPFPTAGAAGSPKPVGQSKPKPLNPFTPLSVPPKALSRQSPKQKRSQLRVRVPGSTEPKPGTKTLEQNLAQPGQTDDIETPRSRWRSSANAVLAVQQMMRGLRMAAQDAPVDEHEVEGEEREEDAGQKTSSRLSRSPRLSRSRSRSRRWRWRRSRSRSRRGCCG